LRRYRSYYGKGVGKRNTPYRKEKSIIQSLYRLFGYSMWHSYSTRKDKFRAGRPCYCCHVNQAIKRIWINVWGTCYQVDVCKEHCKFHGTNREEIPDCIPMFAIR